MRNSFKKGMSIIEIVIAAGIIAVSVTGIIGAIQIYLKIVHQNARSTQAVMFLDEATDALQSIRDQDYNTFKTLILDQEYSLFWNGVRYELATSTILLPYDMKRTIVFTEVQRDGSDSIVSSGGSIDENTRKANIKVEWYYQEKIKTISSEMLIHNLYEN